MAMMASNGAALDADAAGSDVRSEVDDERRSPAPRDDDVVDWIWDAEYSLLGFGRGSSAQDISHRDEERGGQRVAGTERRTSSTRWAVPTTPARIARRCWPP